MAAALISAAVSPVAANAYSAFYVFGDSLSDAGNVFVGTHGTEPASPYSNGVFSNGPVWAQDVSISLGLGPLEPSLLPGGTDYAAGSATTSYPLTESTLVPTLTQQIEAFLATTNGTAPSSALYSVWIGSNDLFNILGSNVNAFIALSEAQNAAQSAATDIGKLIAAGARDILVPLVPDLGVTPLAIAAGASGAARQLAETYNAALEADIASLGSVAGLDLTYLDTFTLVDQIVGDPAAYGFSNVSSPCYVGSYFGGGTACTDPNSYLFWDEEHPSAVGQADIAAAALPEPGTMGLMATGLAGIAFIRRRNKNG